MKFLLIGCLFFSSSFAVAQKDQSFIKKIVRNVSGFFSKSKTETAGINEIDKEDLLGPDYYTVISSTKIEKELQDYFNSILSICDLKNKSHHYKLNVFKIRVTELRNYLDEMLNEVPSHKINYAKRLKLAHIYSQTSEKNVQFLKIINSSSFKNKTASLKNAFNNFYVFYSKRDEEDISEWASKIIQGIECTK